MKNFKTLMFNTIAGRGTIIGTVICTAGIGLNNLNNYLENRIENNSPVHYENVIAGPEPETYIEKNGEKFYSAIDGIPVENYKK